MNIPYGKQSVSLEDVESVVACLNSEFLTQGPKVGLFEDAISSRVGARYCVAVNSATSALHIALLALEVGSGDLVWTSPITFVATANAALYCGAKVDFVDIDPETFNLSPTSLREKLEHAKRQGSLPKVVIPVHMAGQPADMKDIFELSKEFGFKILEDASHALGSTYEGLPTGSCKFSDIAVFSFHPVKMITTGEGGACVTNDLNYARKMRSLRSHGLIRSHDEFEGVSDGGWYYEQIGLGFNYRITDIQCALGYSQLNRLDNFVTKRNAIAAEYSRDLAATSLQLPVVDLSRTSSFHLYIVRTLGGAKERLDLYNRLQVAGIKVNVHYIPVYRHPYYKRLLGTDFQPLPNAETYYWSAISLPIFPDLTRSEYEHVVDFVTSALSRLGQVG